MQKQDNSGKASNNVIKFVTPKLQVVRHVSSPQGSSLHTNQSANYGLLLTNILLANILATECMIRMWWTGNLAVLRSYMKWAEIDATPDYPLQRFAPYEWHAKEREGEDNAASV